MTGKRGLFALALAVATVGSCGQPGRSSRRVVGDTIVLTVRLPARLDTARLDIVAQHELPGEPGDSMAPRVTALAVDAAGRVHLALGDGTILRLKAGGAFDTALVATLHVPGRRSHPVVAFVPTDSGLIARHADGSVVRFAGNGQPVSVWFPGETAGLSAQQLLSATDDTVRAGLSPLSTSDARAVSVAMPINQELRDTLQLPSGTAANCTASPDPHFRSGSYADIRVRYLPSLLWAPLPSGAIVAGCNHGYTFDILVPGKPVRRVQHVTAAVPVSAEERTSFVNAWTLRLRNATDGPGPAWTWRGDTLRGVKPAYLAMLTGSDGRIWIWPAQASVAVPAPPQWVFLGGPRQLWVEPTHGTFDVFDRTGEFTGRVAVAAGLAYSPFGATPPPLIRGDTLWWIVQDGESSTPALVRTHVHWTPGR